MYAAVVIDIKNKDVDRPFTYRIPNALQDLISVGCAVRVPFGPGNRIRTGYVVSLDAQTSIPEDRIKDIDSVPEKAANVDDDLLKLAIWMRYRYGGSLYQAISTVIPNKVQVEARKLREYVFTGTAEDLERESEISRKKRAYARLRLLEAFAERNILPADIVRDRLQITSVTLKSLTEKGLVQIRSVQKELLNLQEQNLRGLSVSLNEEQASAVKSILEDGRTGHLLYGITGSGKTEVYLRLIKQILRDDREAIVLIPEIALTYQNVMRFYNCFGNLVSVVHSRLSKGEKWERFERARNGEIKVMIGPRSALFTPFKKLGLIIIDEFHESSYLSDQVPKYSTVETALRRAENEAAKVVMGSATPSVEVYQQALDGVFGYHVLHKRAVPGAVLPSVGVVDLRKELREKNRSIFSRILQEKIRERLQKNEQVMLFLNRRGYSGSVSCRACGKPVECPHCSVPLNYHKNGMLKCHFCSYEMRMVKTCPSCGSGMIGTFGIGTERVEELAQEMFPGVRTLRMDADTTAGKDGHRTILEKFANHEADMLIGTQMIVKGHDFPLVTLVGILAADLSLNVPDYRSAERTFQLLTQAEGRAGRGETKGECVVQTYYPEHYAIEAAARQDYESFFKTELLFRKAMQYPPAGLFAGVRFSGIDWRSLKQNAESIASSCRNTFEGTEITFLGPAEESAFKVKDQYRYTFHIKCKTEDELIAVKKHIEALAATLPTGDRTYITFES